jgi:hypothetical protein
MTTTSTDTIHADIATLIRKVLPRWATAVQLDILTDRFCSRYAWGWICGDGSSGGAHSERGATKAASRAAGRAARRCSGPAPWTAVIDLDTAVGGGDQKTTIMKTIIVPADPDQDDCLSATADTYITEHPEAAGWNLQPRWADDDRETVALTVPSE